MALIPHPVRASEIARPDHAALVGPSRTWTYRELAAEVALASSSVDEPVVDLGGYRDPRFVVDLHAVGWAGAAARVRRDGPRLPQGSGHREPVSWATADERLLIETSGTSGQRRTVRLTTEQLLFSAMGSAIRLGHHLDDRWLCCLPLHHIGGLAILYRCAWYATTVVLHPDFDADAVNDELDAGATLVSLVPTMLERVLDSRGGRPLPPHLRAMLIGGAPMSDALLERCRRERIPVAVSWGMSEAASQVATRFPGESCDRSAPPLPFVAVDAVDGRLRVTGPLVGGELLTSDAGTIEANGQVRVTGRADDLLISGGENIAPAEIEAMLERHPAVKRAAVRGVDDETWGQRPVAWVVAGDVSDDELRAWCQRELESFKVPDRFIRVTALPTNDLGKLVRSELTEAAPDPEG